MSRVGSAIARLDCGVTEGCFAGYPFRPGSTRKSDCEAQELEPDQKASPETLQSPLLGSMDMAGHGFNYVLHSFLMESHVAKRKGVPSRSGDTLEHPDALTRRVGFCDPVIRTNPVCLYLRAVFYMPPVLHRPLCHLIGQSSETNPLRNNRRSLVLRTMYLPTWAGVQGYILGENRIK
ncbi:hypothetical protein PpBr36_03010 [Pyricularia pennisetigena]|uniref:hypothetical protein n=1 Tax=Pyricularia pennisetigena TaxID=1578925 RepID=UPI00115033B9|nr:hypothetical protein PpBr36_03010 [Pyricularia pennisetigena]TLS30131.1 hypothetical protein PpBr36_03010 [Pyricularia pennisetigena]